MQLIAFFMWTLKKDYKNMFKVSRTYSKLHLLKYFVNATLPFKGFVSLVFIQHKKQINITVKIL